MDRHLVLIVPPVSSAVAKLAKLDLGSRRCRAGQCRRNVSMLLQYTMSRGAGTRGTEQWDMWQVAPVDDYGTRDPARKGVSVPP
jgi:hypothetical protein